MMIVTMELVLANSIRRLETLFRSSVLGVMQPFSAPYQTFRGILKERPALPSAFVCDDDTIASGVMRALAEAGYHVPEDISVIGFNDRPSSEMTSPPLTSVNVPRTSFGAEGIDALVRLIQKREQGITEVRPLKLRIGTQLVCRESVRNLVP